MNDTAVDIGYPEIPSRVTVSKLFVIQAHQVKDGGMEIVDVHAVMDGLHSKFIGGSVADTSLNTALHTSLYTSHLLHTSGSGGRQVEAWRKPHAADEAEPR